MERNKIAAAILAEFQTSIHVAELIKMGLNICVNAGLISKDSEINKLALALETLLKSDLFTMLVSRMIPKTGSNNGPGINPVGWQSTVGTSGAQSPVQTPG